MTTYNTLLTDIQNYFQKGSSSDTTIYAALPGLITRAEKVLGRSVKLLLQCTPAVSAFTVSSNVITKPDRWRETISINFNPSGNLRVFIFPRSYEYLRTVYPDDNVTGDPQYYSDYDYEHWIVAPTPPLAYAFEVLFYQNPAYLSVSNQSNWWTEYAPELLQARVFLEVAMFLSDKDQEARWNIEYEKLLAAVNGEDQSGAIDRTTVRKSK
jgi:hypothetical protein